MLIFLEILEVSRNTSQAIAASCSVKAIASAIKARVFKVPKNRYIHFSFMKPVA